MHRKEKKEKNLKEIKKSVKHMYTPCEICIYAGRQKPWKRTVLFFYSVFYKTEGVYLQGYFFFYSTTP